MSCLLFEVVALAGVQANNNININIVKQSKANFFIISPSFLDPFGNFLKTGDSPLT
jgi:hypothetical protein